MLVACLDLSTSFPSTIENLKDFVSDCVIFLFQDSNQYQFGKTKIFFRAGQVAYLEKLRLDKLRQGCVVIQKHIRGWLQRKKFLRERRAALIIQQYFRGQQTVRYVGTRKTCAIIWLSSPSPRGAGPPFSWDPGADASPEVAVSLQVRWVCPRGQVVLTACCPHVAEVTTRTLKRGSPDQRAAEEGQNSW